VIHVIGVRQSHVVPLGRYFLVIGPSLAAFLWFIGSYMEPDPPVRTPAAAQAAKPGTTGSAQAVKPAPTATVQAAEPAPAAAIPVQPAAAPSPATNEATATTASAEPAPPPVQAAQEQKKRKQVAQRRHRRNNYASTARRQYYGTPYAPYYAYAPGYRSFPYGMR
jgi:hypothetical protein